MPEGGTERECGGIERGKRDRLRERQVERERERERASFKKMNKKKATMASYEVVVVFKGRSQSKLPTELLLRKNK